MLVYGHVRSVGIAGWHFLSECFLSMCLLQADGKTRDDKDKGLGNTATVDEDAMPADAPRALAAFYQKGRR